jgi:hypothetical protein
MVIPLKVYLDSSDYRAFVLGSESSQRVLNYLLEKKEEGRIVIPFSYLTIVERSGLGKLDHSIRWT